MINVCDINVMKPLLAEHGFHFSKAKGQNFLIARWVPESIAEDAGVDKTAGVLEIGPGIGPLTQQLCLRAGKVCAVEVDTRLEPILKQTVGEFDNLEILWGDVLKQNIPALVAEKFGGLRPMACANLPYYITTPILMKLIESKLPFDSITVMVQTEVAERLAAGAGKKNCGAITAAIDYYGHAERLFVVNAERFMPPPKVNSAVAKITLWKDKPIVPKDEDMFFRTVKAAFEQRRKTLPNSLMTGFSGISKERLTEIIVECGHRPDVRGEKLTVADFCKLSDALYDEINK